MNKNNYWNNYTRDIALMGVYLGLFLAIGFIPQVGLIYIPPVYLTTFPILMFIIIFIHQNFKFSLFAGLAFGMTSLLMAAVRPMGSKDWLYLNPLISVLPRITWSMLVYWLLLIGPKKWLQLPWLLFVIFATYWVHALMSDFFKFIFFVWATGHDWHNNNLMYSFGLLWMPEHLIEIAIYSAFIPFVWIKARKVFKTIKTDKEIVIFDYSRTIAFGEGKERSIPENIQTHLKNLKNKYEVIVITGRKYSKVESQLMECGIVNIIERNGLRLHLNGNEFVGYSSIFASPTYSRALSIKLASSIFNSKVHYIVSDNKTERVWKNKSGLLFTVESHHKKLDDVKLYDFKK